MTAPYDVRSRLTQMRLSTATTTTAIARTASTVTTMVRDDKVDVAPSSVRTLV